MRILLSGMIAADPGHGGAAWAVLQYILGFKRLGHDVAFVEPVDELTDARVSYFRRVCEEFDLGASSALVRAGTSETVGLSYAGLRRIARSTDLLVNVNGILREEELIVPIPVRVYLDIDAGFNQLWHATQGIDRGFDGHTHHVTIGQAIGKPDCAVPDCGIEWLKTLQPVVLERWPVVGNGIRYDALTTVGNWRGYGSFEHRGVFYGQKAHSLRALIDLPKRTGETFVLALSIHPGEKRDLEALAANGWRLVDPARVAATPSAYREFIQASRAEFGLVKHGCVAAPCGWFSDRSVCYLASGRPVIAQDTGFGDYLPTGEGLFAFHTADGALAAIETLRADYERHRRAARALAEEYFDSDKVLSRMLDVLGAA